MIIIILIMVLTVVSTVGSIIAIAKYRKIQDKLEELIERLKYNET
jgi:Na+/melibiose symporter-like transporter